MTKRARIVPKAQRKHGIVQEYLSHFISTPLWLRTTYEPTRDQWPLADAKSLYGAHVRVSWIDPTGHEVRGTMIDVADGTDDMSDLRVHPYDLGEEIP